MANKITNNEEYKIACKKLELLGDILPENASSEQIKQFEELSDEITRYQDLNFNILNFDKKVNDKENNKKVILQLLDNWKNDYRDNSEDLLYFEIEKIIERESEKQKEYIKDLEETVEELKVLKRNDRIYYNNHIKELEEEKKYCEKSFENFQEILNKITDNSSHIIELKSKITESKQYLKQKPYPGY